MSSIEEESSKQSETASVDQSQVESGADHTNDSILSITVEAYEK